MPVSNPQHIPAVLHYVHACEPRRILDVGIGTGSYGLLLRQGLDIGYGRVRREEWQVRIEGVEVFEAYRNPVWSYAYDAVHIGDIRELHPRLGEFDVVLCNDVLEHFEIDEARRLIRLFQQIGHVLIATTPNREYPQGAWGGNEAETHRSLLGRADFDGLVAETITGDTTCYVCTRRTELIYPLLLASDRCVQVAPGQPGNLFVRVRRKLRHWLLTRRLARSA